MNARSRLAFRRAADIWHHREATGPDVEIPRAALAKHRYSQGIRAMATRSHWALATSLLILSFSLATGAAQAQQVDDPTQYTYEQLKQNIVLGKTTKEELRAKYGEPDSINRASAKEGGYERSWTYYPSESHGEKIRGRVTGFLRGLVPGKARTAGDVAQEHGVGARNVKDFALYIDLNKDGVVEDFDLTEWNNSQRSF